MIQPWEKISERYAYRGWRDLIRRRFRLPDGREADYDIFGNDSFVTVAALTEQEEFILVRQFRPGPEKVLTSFPEGYLDENETPQVAAARELQEETGYVAERITLLKEVRNSYTTECQYCMLATGCRRIQSQQLDPLEFIEVFTVSPTELLQMMTDPEEKSFANIGSGFLALEAIKFK